MKEGGGGTDGKVVSENHTIKVLAEPNGLLVSLTTKTYSYLLFVSKPLIGVRRIVTRDRIVAKAGYDIERVLALIEQYYPTGHEGAGTTVDDGSG